MINAITIKNFKALKDIKVELKNLCLFTGLNGMGKSTLIQSILLLRQSYNQNYLQNSGLNLNGDLATIGLAQDAFNESSNEEFIQFKIDYDNNIHLDWMFQYQLNSDVLPIMNFNLNGTNFYEESYLNENNLTIFNNNFNYLSAERLAPKIIYPYSSYEILGKKSLGKNGEYSAHFLDAFGSENIPFINLKHPDSEVLTLLSQVSFWLSEISSGLRPRSSSMSNINSVLLNYEFKKSDGYTRAFKAPNVGFGISYILPVLTAILSAKADTLLIIENPESHIHPRGQTKLGELIALAASNGVQLMIESHSDHILNGIRVAVKKYKLPPEKFGVYFFERKNNIDGHESEIIIPKLDSDGRIDKWPINFFDEWENSLIELM